MKFTCTQVREDFGEKFWSHYSVTKIERLALDSCVLVVPLC